MINSTFPRGRRLSSPNATSRERRPDAIVAVAKQDDERVGFDWLKLVPPAILFAWLALDTYLTRLPLQ